MPAVGPTEGERHFLYLLLQAVPGASSFENLRSIGLDTYPDPTFQAAALARGLCDSNDHYYAALEQVVQTSTAACARGRFALMLACCDIADPARLWRQFRLELADDFHSSSGSPWPWMPPCTQFSNTLRDMDEKPRTSGCPSR